MPPYGDTPPILGTNVTQFYLLSYISWYIMCVRLKSKEIRLDYYPADQLHGLYVCVAAPRSSCADLLLPSVLFIFHMALGN